MPSVTLPPDFGPRQPHPTAGATAVGARPVLVAYNVWVSSLEVARRVAPLVRGPAVRALGLAVGDGAQVSCNLVDPAQLGPAQVYDAVRRLVEEAGGAVTGAELVGLLPEAILRAIPAPAGPNSASAPTRRSRPAWTGPADQAGLATETAQVRRRALPESRRCRARARRTRRRSRSLMPPQMPNFSPLASAYSRQSSRTTQPRHTSFASRVDAPRSGKNRSGSTPMQFA